MLDTLHKYLTTCSYMVPTEAFRFPLAALAMSSVETVKKSIKNIQGVDELFLRIYPQKVYDVLYLLLNEV